MITVERVAKLMHPRNEVKREKQVQKLIEKIQYWSMRMQIEYLVDLQQKIINR